MNPKAPPAKAATVGEIVSPNPLIGSSPVLDHASTSRFGPPEGNSDSVLNLHRQSTDLTAAGDNSNDNELT